jgi:hypothetical protein
MLHNVAVTTELAYSHYSKSPVLSLDELMKNAGVIQAGDE